VARQDSEMAGPGSVRETAFTLIPFVKSNAVLVTQFSVNEVL
jgi:hypothetical protein